MSAALSATNAGMVSGPRDDFSSAKVSRNVQPRAGSLAVPYSWLFASDAKEFVSKHRGCVKLCSSFKTARYVYEFTA